MTQNILIQNWGISSWLIIWEAGKLWYNVEIISKEKNLFSVSKWRNKVYFKSVDCWINSSFGLKAANDKELTYLVWEDNNICVPKSLYLNSGENIDISELQKKLTLPVISKPIDWAHGDWVFLNITNNKHLKEAIKYSFLWDVKRIVVQEQISWEDHRIIVIGSKVIAGTKRIPPEVTGNWIETIEELINSENTNPDRLWVDHKNKMSPIKIDEELINCLKEQDYNILTILEKWKKIRVRKNANLSSGWSAIDITDNIHPEILEQCVKLSEKLWLRMCWVDVFSDDISRPLTENNGAIIEVNATPWIRMHHFPSIWTPRNVAKELLNFIFD